MGDDWHIKYLIDLEWACSLPVETLRPPYSLTGCTADDLVGPQLDTFSEGHREFMEIFEEERNHFAPRNRVRTDITVNLRSIPQLRKPTDPCY